MRKCFDSALSLNISYCFFPHGKKVSSISHLFFIPIIAHLSHALILKKLNPITVTIVSA